MASSCSRPRHHRMATMAPGADRGRRRRGASRGKTGVRPSQHRDRCAGRRHGPESMSSSTTTPASGPWDDAIVSAMKETRRCPDSDALDLEVLCAARSRYRRSGHDGRDGASLKCGRGRRRAGRCFLERTWEPRTRTLLEEYVLMARAGMSFRQILATLTTAPAAKFGESKETGRIAERFSSGPSHPQRRSRQGHLARSPR